MRPLEKAENDLASGRLRAVVDLAPSSAEEESATTVLAAVAGTTSDTGDYAATPLSASATWEAGGSAGDFSWTYPFRTPPGVGGPEPNLALSYSSQQVDGMTASTNNQPSPAGQGFQLGTSYVERKYWSCVDDGNAGKGDLCWGSDNATLVLDGKATELIKDASTGAWRLKEDDGSRIEKLTNDELNGDNDQEYWKLTTTDGRQYFFGKFYLPGAPSSATGSVWTVPVVGDDSGEPCHSDAGYADSFCDQAWRWNLDYVVDPKGNASSYWYSAEDNYYAKNGDTSPGVGRYIRGGVLTRVEYGQRAGSLASPAAPMRVQLGYQLRCIADTQGNCPDTEAGWPDVPLDQLCSGTQACTQNFTPTFFGRRRLASVTTQVYQGTAYQDVDSWTLTHTFPAQRDGTAASLWLESITHTGKAGGASLTLPNVVFGGVELMNRVDNPGGLAAFYKWRVREVTSETGGRLRVNYETDCFASSGRPAPDTNTLRCFPSYWTPEGATEPMLDWFQKYVVTDVSEIDLTGGSPTVTTTYNYGGGGAWRYDSEILVPTRYRTWSDWRGYQTITSTVGSSTGTRSESTALYFRGMHGDRTAAGGTKTVNVVDSEGNSVTDSNYFQGFLRESRVFAAPGGTELSGQVNLPWARQTAAGGGRSAYIVRTRSVKTRTTLDGNRGVRRTTTVNEFTDDGLIASVDDQGDDAAGQDDRCTRTTYAQNRAAWMLEFPLRVETVSVACAGTPSRPDDVVSDVRTAYDDQAVGAAPTKGNATSQERAASYSGGSPVYQTVARTVYDSQGRKTAVTDADNKTTRTAYTPATGGPLTKTVETNSLGHTLTKTVDPAWGLPTQTVDANTKITDLSYDALGRLTSVWLPNRSQAGSQNPNLKFSYLVSSSAANAVSTSTIRDDGTNYNTSWEVFDGWLRTRQTQKPGPNGGRIINESVYETRGLLGRTRADFYNSSAPGSALVTITDAATPALTTNVYDGAKRKTTETLTTSGTERWHTTTGYGGDRTYTDPPDGAPGLTEIIDARGNVIERHEHPSGAASGAYTATKYSYDPADRLARIVDAENNIWTYTFDLRGRQTESTDPDSGRLTQTFDNLDRIATSSDARSKTLAYSYDAIGRKTGLYVGSTSGTQLAGWTYDTVTGAKGQLASATRYAGGNTYVRRTTEYDALYRATKIETAVPSAEEQLAGTYTSTAAYSLDGSLDQSTEPAAGGLPAETLTYTDNQLGMQLTMTGTSTLVDGTTYTNLGDPQQYTLQAVSDRFSRISMEYEPGTRRLSRAYATTQIGTATPVTPIDLRSTYNHTGDITATSDEAGSVDELECYRRDGHRRLIDVWTQPTDTCAATPSLSVLGGPAPYWTSWAYTPTGLRKTQTAHSSSGDTTTTYNHPAAGGPRPHAVSNLTSSTGTVKNFEYDDAGNTTSRVNHINNNTQTLDWDDEGHLATITEAGSTTSNIYDADGELLIRRSSTETVLFLGQTEAHLSSAGALSGNRNYTHNGKTIAVRATVSGGGTKLSWLFTDHHGTALESIDASTHTASRRRVNPFGVLRNNPTWPSTRSFVGGYGNQTLAAGMVHLGAREYDPAIGRFISVDPLLAPKDPQSLTGYSYASNNPVTLADPSGLLPIEEDYNGCGGCSPEAADPYTPLPEVERRPRGELIGPLECGMKCTAQVSCIGCGPNPFTELAMMAIPFSDLPGCVKGNQVDCAFAAVDAIPIGGTVIGAGRYAFKSADEAAAAVKGAYAVATPALVWKMNPFKRGRRIEEMLGANLPSPNYPVIDSWDTAKGLATSIKSIDLDARTYQNLGRVEKRLNRYVDAVSKFKGRDAWGDVGPIRNTQIRARELLVAIPRAPSKAERLSLVSVATRAQSRGVRVEYVIFE